MRLIREYERKLWPIVEAEYERQLRGWRRLYHEILKTVRPISYPLKRVVEAWKATRRYGSTVEKKLRLPAWRQFLQQISLYVKYGLPPTSYYDFRLFHDDIRKNAKFYVHHKQMDVLLRGIIIISGSETESSLLRNKLEFFRHCRLHDISTPSVLLAFREGSVIPCVLSQGESLPRRNLFSKPVEGERGFGARRWHYVENESRYRDGDGNLLTEAELRTALRRKSRNRGIVLQEQVRNHPKLETLAGETLCVARVVTGRKPEGRPNHVISTMRLPENEGVTSNFSDGGIGTGIDPSTGRLGEGFYKSTNFGEVINHPVTGGRIIGFRIPDWKEAMNITKSAHSSLSRVPFVGWDVAFTRSGPVIIEGNTGFGAEVLQIPHKKPLLETDFLDLYRYNFEYWSAN